jgi:micrococcal nuclease
MKEQAMNYLNAAVRSRYGRCAADLYFNKIALLPFILIGLLISHDIHADAIINAKVISVLDGNTLEVLTQDERKLKVLLYGIDSPELGQNFGKEAKIYLEGLVLNKEVAMETQGKDSFGNHVVIIIVENRVDLSVELLKQGLAWTSEKDVPKDLEPYRTWAQRKGRGLWQEQNPIAPWMYRRQQAMQKPKIR